MRTFSTTFLMMIVLSRIAAAATPAAETGSLDWPQWRGPNRDGIAANGPKLLDIWPAGGPKLLWKSGPIPSGTKGGAGSVAVAGGKLFVFVHSRRINGMVILTTMELTEMGWVEGVPDDLIKKIDESIKSEKWRNLKPGPAMDDYIKEFSAMLDPKLVEKFGPFIRTRMNQQPLNWDGLVRLANIRDKEIPALEKLRDFIGLSVHESVYDGAYQTARALLNKKYAGYLDTVICLDAATGKELWRKDFPGDITKQMEYWGASSTPAVWDNKCYVTGSAGFYCLSVKDGALVWQARTKFSNSSPLVTDGAVFAMVPELTCYDAGTGAVRWTNPLNNVSGSVAPWTSGGNHYVLGCTGDERYGALFCVDAAIGKVAWQMPMQGNAATPVVVGDTVVTRGNEVTRFKITPQKAEVLWTTKSDADPGSPIVFQDCVFVTGGHCVPYQVRCIDFQTGTVKWDQGKKEIRCSTPVLADGKLFTLGNETDLLVVKPTTEKYVELTSFTQNAAPCTSPTIAGGKLYARLDDCIACWDITQYGPFVDKTTVAKDKVTFNFKQAGDGLAIKDSAIQGLSITDATGLPKTPKAQINGASLSVEFEGAVFPLKISYASGNLGARGEPAAAFEWKTPRLQFQQCNGNSILLTLDGSVDQNIWKDAKTYTVSGAVVTKVDIDKANNAIRLTTDCAWKVGDKAVIKYAATPELPGVLAELSFTAVPGQAVGEGLLKEFLIGELQEKIDPAKAFEMDALDKNTRPAGSEKWKLCKEEAGVFDLLKYAGSQNNAVVHACTYLYSDANRKVQLWAGSDDGIQIVVNGKVVHSNPAIRGCAVDSDKIRDVELKQGWNTVLLGISQGSGGWGFCLRIRNEPGDGPPVGLRYMAELPVAP